LLDPTTPPEGKLSRHVTHPDDPPTRTEQRSSGLGIHFTRGRTWTSNSHLAHEAAEFANEHGDAPRFQRAMFKAYFEDLADIANLDVVVAIGKDAGLPETELMDALMSGRYRANVDEKLAWAQEAGVTAVPTFVLGEQYGIVGAQDRSVFENLLLKEFGKAPKSS
jgi:predicted DsbA family dithiol-disulfide isomerase